MLENERTFTVKCDNVKFEREMKTKQPFRRPAEFNVKKGGSCYLNHFTPTDRLTA